MKKTKPLKGALENEVWVELIEFYNELNVAFCNKFKDYKRKPQQKIVDGIAFPIVAKYADMISFRIKCDRWEKE